MKYIFFLIIVFSNISSAYSLDKVLDLYRKSSDLSNKTKNESLGHLTLYTRDDLERMQAHTLKDLLNSIRLFRYDENLLGIPDPLHQDPLLYRSDLVKIFVDNHEITSAYAGSGLYIYGNIDLGFIDHVEIYEGSTSTYVNSEPSVITIKLYTKDPERELGNEFMAYGGSRGTHHEEISHADVVGALQYYAYASHTKMNRERYEHDNHTLSRDYKDIHAFMNMKYKKFDLEAEVIDHTMDPFLSASMFATPNSGNIDYTMSRVSSHMKILDDDSLQLSASFMRINSRMNFSMDGPRWTTDPTKLLMPKDTLKSHELDDTFNIKIEKSIAYRDQNIIIGSEYSKRKLHDVVIYNLGVKNQNPATVNNSIVSAYAQDDYAISSGQMISLSGKINHYNSQSNRGGKIFNTKQFRLAYIYTSDSDIVKIFASHMQLPVSEYTLATTTQTEIEILNINDFSAHYSKDIGKHTVGICVGVVENENPKRVIAQGANKYNDNYSISLDYDYKFDPFNSLKSMIYMNKLYNQLSREYDTIHGGMLRLLNTWRKFDFYNELNYYKQLDSEIDGINYNAGVRYRATDSLVFSFKGTNIFDSAAKSKYSYIKMVGFKPTMQSLYISPIDRLFTVGLEYDF